MPSTRRRRREVRPIVNGRDPLTDVVPGGVGGSRYPRVGPRELLSQDGPLHATAPDHESAFIISLSDTLQAALATACRGGLTEAARAWSETDEHRGITADTALHVLVPLSGLADRAGSGQRRL
ncbi:hypothetical protein GCM10010388_65900 [Streptomyces mauvecolor]